MRDEGKPKMRHNHDAEDGVVVLKELVTELAHATRCS
jgi:hypothetical protein